MRLLPKILVVMTALAVGGIAWGGWKLTPWGQLQYVSDRTGIELPSFPSQLFECDDAEMSITVHARLSPDHVAKTLSMTAFREDHKEPHRRPALPSELFRAER